MELFAASTDYRPLPGNDAPMSPCHGGMDGTEWKRTASPRTPSTPTPRLQRHNTGRYLLHRLRNRPPRHFLRAVASALRSAVPGVFCADATTVVRPPKIGIDEPSPAAVVDTLAPLSKSAKTWRSSKKIISPKRLGFEKHIFCKKRISHLGAFPSLAS